MDKLKTIVKVLDEKLAEDIVVIDMSIDSPICDYFVIASASNERLLLALKDHIEDACDYVQLGKQVADMVEKIVNGF